MKFAEHLRESSIPEWRDKYIDYKLGKKKLKSYKDSIKTSEAIANNVFSTPATGYSRETTVVRRAQNKYTDIQRHLVGEFIQNWCIREELGKCNSFYLWQLDQCGKKYKVLEEQIECYKAQLLHDSSSDYLQQNGFPQQNSYGTLLSTERKIDQPPNELGTFRFRFQFVLQELELLPSLPTFSHFPRLKRIFGHTHSKVLPTIHGEMFTPVRLTPRQIKQQLSNAIVEYYLFLQLLKNYRELNVTGFRKIIKKFDKTCKTDELADFMEYSKANFELFQHFDANLQNITQQMQNSVSADQHITPVLDQESEDQQDPLVVWETKVTHWYTDVLTSSPKDRKHHAQKLRNLSMQYSLTEQIIHRNNSSIAQIFTAGLFLGISCTLIGYTLYLGFTALPTSKLHKVILPLWGGWYMVLLMSCFFVLNCFIWHRSKINYRFIMFGEIHSRNGTSLFNNDFAPTRIALKLYFVSCLLFTCSIFATVSFLLVSLSPWSLIWLLLAFFMFLWPRVNLHLPYWDKLFATRRWLAITFVRLVLSGFYPVQFGDFFLGDIICSLTYSMADIAMFFCIYSSTPDGLCGSSNSKAMGVMTCIPSIWRLIQCLRRYFDSGAWFPHLLNGVKYSVSVAYNISLCSYRLSSRNTTRRSIFITIAAINSVFTALWDLVMDWSLFQRNSNNLFLRDDLYLAGKRDWKNGTYSPWRKSVYYFAMIWDVLIRFEWVVYAVAPEDMQQSAVTSFVLATLELLRRFIWVIFRVENEHVANVHLFKVSGETPLPYPCTKVEDEDEFQDLMIDAIPSPDEFTMLNVVDLHPEEPVRAYRPIRNRNSSVLENMSRAIPWAHASDFQRPHSVPKNAHAIQDSDGSESESESFV